jgi:hypothetical protein
LLVLGAYGLFHINWKYVSLVLFAFLLLFTPSFSLDEGVLYQGESL